jgi:ribosome-associated toxin RatA of RatAB toxin-antitoxin module
VIAACAFAASACTVHVLPDRPHRDQAAAAAVNAVVASEKAAPRPSDEPVMTEIAIPGNSHIKVRSMVVVNASIDRVRSVVFGFERYPEFMPNYKTCHVVSTTPAGAREVRMEIEVLGGILKLWTRMEVSPAAVTDGVEAYDARFLEGNVKDFSTRWELRELDRASTRLTVESFMELRIPLPDSVVNRGSVDGAREAILAIKQRAESDAPAR